MKTLSILIPVHNEKNTILEILKRVEEVDLSSLGFQKQIIVIDDGSTDGTSVLLQSQSHHGILLTHAKKNGKGSAIRTGLEHAQGEYVIIQDADLEYHPKDYVALLRMVIEKNAEVVFGSRRLKQDNIQYSGLSFYLGGLCITWLTNALYGLTLTDEPTCYKLIKTDLLKSLSLTCRGFEFCPEVTAKLAKRGHTIHEVPIHYAPRHSHEGKKLKWKDGLTAVWVLLKNKFS